MLPLLTHPSSALQRFAVSNWSYSQQPPPHFPIIKYNYSAAPNIPPRLAGQSLLVLAALLGSSSQVGLRGRARDLLCAWTVPFTLVQSAQLGAPE